MRNLILLLVVGIITTSCAVNKLKYVTTDGLDYDGTYVYSNGEKCAKLTSIEVAYDDGKLVKEATFTLLSAKYNEEALRIIKKVRENQPSWEVEVELRMQ